jgi:hypothetical protein
MTKNIARIVITKECDRDCQGCCNKQRDLDSLPIIGDEQYDMIILTGGEPLKFIEELTLLILWFRSKSQGQIIVYTAKLDNANGIYAVLNLIDGITITLHEPSDVEPFRIVDKHIAKLTGQRSCRLNVFKGVTVPTLQGKWAIKDEMEWLDPCPLPKGEVLLRTPKFLGEYEATYT